MRMAPAKRSRASGDKEDDSCSFMKMSVAVLGKSHNKKDGQDGIGDY